MTDRPIRCFIALTIPEETQNRLAGIQDSLKKNGAKARWVKKTNIHITLRFLGDRPAKKIDSIKAMLSETFPQLSAINTKIDHLEAFPNMKKPRVVWAGVSEAVDQMKAISEKLDNGLARLGIPKEREEFIPHLTLARCKTPEESRATAEAIKKAPIDPIEAPLTSITFYQSTLNAQGSVYEPIFSIGDTYLI